MQHDPLADSHPRCGSNPQQGRLPGGEEGEGKGSPGTCLILLGGATALVFTQECTWEPMQCGRSPELGSDQVPV